MIVSDIEEKISRVLKRKFALPSDLAKVDLVPAPKHIRADLSSPWAMKAGKVLKKSPMEIAKTACGCLKDVDGIISASVSPPGFINIELSGSTILHNLAKIAAEAGTYNKPAVLPRQKILIEFVSANPTGPLHIASGRGAAIGDSLANILTELGYKVSKEYYVNDAGRQAQLLGESLKARCEGKPPPEDGYMGDYLIELAQKVPKENNLDYRRFAIDEILKMHKKDMSDFNVEFDEWFMESSLYEDGSVTKTLEKLKHAGKAYHKDGAVWFGLVTDKDAKERVLVKKDKQPTYFLSDLAYHKNKYERGFDTLINVWGADHYGYINRMKEGLKALGKIPDTLKIILHQLVHIKEGEKLTRMSKRAGKFKTLHELTSEVGTDACRFFFAAVSPNSHMIFDTALAKQKTKENPVYYVQYVCARISSVFSSAKEKNIDFDFMEDFTDIELKEAERNLIKKLLWYNPVLKNCIKDLTPHYLANYVLELAKLFHPFYDSLRILDLSNPQTTRLRLLICRGVQVVIKRGLNMLGVSAPDEM